MIADGGLGASILLTVGCWALSLAIPRMTRRPLFGLALVYYFQQFLNYVLVTCLYWLDQHNGPVDTQLVVGFQKVAASNISFAIGFLLGAAMVHPTATSSYWESGLRRDVNWIFKLGLIATFVLVPLFGSIPSFGAAVGHVSGLFVVGIGLVCYLSVRDRNIVKATSVLCLSAVTFPLAGILQGGFIGFGVSSVILIFSIFAMRFRPTWLLVPLAILMCYLGTSVFVAYLHGRNDIRAAVWGNETYAERIRVVRDVASNFEWFDYRNTNHVAAVNVRLNQTSLVGAAAVQLEAGHIDYAKGSTIVQAAIGIIPRAIWPTKPLSAGGSALVSKFTGQIFGEWTSVGVGPILELYINFDDLGLLIGSVLLGVILGQLDARAGAAAVRGKGWSCARWFLLGIPFTHALTSIGEVVMSVSATMVIIMIIDYVLARTEWLKRRTPSQFPQASLAIPTSIRRRAS